MLRYTATRLLLATPVLVGVSLVSFFLLHLIPGDPAAILGGAQATEDDLQAIRREFLLDAPLPVQYVRYVTRAVRGDLGISIRTRDPVARTLYDRLRFTVQLTLLSISAAIVAGILAGVAAALRRNSWLDAAVMVLALAGVSTPSFWLGLLLLLVFSGTLGWFPAGGAGTLRHLVLPSMVLAASGTAVIARMTRTSMLDVLRQDYVRTLRASGLPEYLVVYKHALRNALNPVVTIVGLNFGALLAGAVVVETVFSLPGIGRLIIGAIFSRDYPVVQGGMLLVAITFVAVNLCTDLTYALLNPRIRY